MNQSVTRGCTYDWGISNIYITNISVHSKTAFHPSHKNINSSEWIITNYTIWKHRVHATENYLGRCEYKPVEEFIAEPFYQQFISY